MCILIYKPKGVEMPSKYILDKASLANPHGFGFVSSNHKLYKTMSYERFMQELAKVDDSENCIIHFRLATHGSICRRNCHPFKQRDVFFAHNGILRIQPINDMTDSETAFKTLLYPTIAKFGLYSDEVNDAVNSIIGYSKFAMMQNDNVRLFGSFSRIKGSYYSNLRFL